MRDLAMRKKMVVVLAFGTIATVAVVSLVMEQRGIATRKVASGGHYVNVSSLMAFGSAAGETHNDTPPKGKT